MIRRLLCLLRFHLHLPVTSYRLYTPEAHATIIVSRCLVCGDTKITSRNEVPCGS